ncbi:uncharacterized protein [Miscanthus floridulus]|uniref:uncharacterized protein n=1 Tax=Miscanthus floridulus TaxID=154761 RepID=UPI00345A6C77
MSSSEDSYISDNSSEGMQIYNVAAAVVLVARLKAAVANAAPVVNPALPFPKMSRRQWMQLKLQNEQKCKENLRMSPDAFLHLHNILLEYGLKGTQQTGSIETLGLYVWTCAHNEAARRSRDRFERSLDTVSRKLTHVAEVICRWVDSILVLTDRSYDRVHAQFLTYAPFFDGCIGALDGTHIKVSVNKEAKRDYINRKGDVTINVCDIVDKDMRFTFVGAGMVGSVHDMAVLREC